MSRLKGLTGLACASSVALPVLLAVPQTGWSQIEEIVVTTRKREESLQDVPLAVQAFGAEQIARQGIEGIADIANLSPSVQFDNSFGPSDTRITVRGLSNTRGRSNVAFLIDGIDVTTENLVAAGSGLLANRRLLGDIERVEVVKGPQSALYGRAAFAGAIAYTTKEPGDEFEGTVRADMAEDGQYQFDLAFGGPISGMEDVLGMRVNGVYWNEDGRYVNSVSGEDVGGGEGYGVAWTTVWTPVDEAKVKARVSYTDEEYDPRATVRVGGGLPLESKPTPDGSQQTDFPPGTQLTCANPTDNVYAPFPQQALDKGIGQASQGVPFFGTITGLADFGPGLCVPKSLGDASNKTVAHSENPWTGKDYEGTRLDTFRASLLATLDTDIGTFTSNTGWTDFDSRETYDQDAQAVGRPDRILAHNQADTSTDTQQFSQEFRFQSDWEGPTQLTLGAFYWEEDRELIDRNIIVTCSPTGKLDAPDGAPASDIPGICDGTNGTVDNWQDYYLSLPVKGEPYIRGSKWDAETEHWSFYASLEFELSEQWKVTLEDRYIDEEFTITKPNHSSCTTTAYAIPDPVAVTSAPLLAETANTDILCESERVLSGNTIAGDDWGYVSGSQSSSFHTPKVTLEWTPTDESLYYFFWAKGQKPGGIAVTVGGGFPVPIREDRFEPEELTAYEFGSKTSFEFVGFNQLNTAFFFQDYTDKQIGTQVLVEGQLAPRIVNAAAAQVWGLELDWTWAPSFLDGLRSTLAYTYLNAEFVDFKQSSTSAQRAAGAGNCPDATAEDIANGLNPDSCIFDFSGNKLDRSPEHAVVWSVDYASQFMGSDFDWFTGFNASWQDDRFLDEENVVKFDSYWLVNARLGLQGEQWEALLYVDNLFDDDTILTGGPGPDFGQQIVETGFLSGFGINHWFGVLPDPRTFGVRLSYNF